jgi:hypothetical protein
MTTLPNMSLNLPVRGSAGAGAWGDTIDADLSLIDAHDHSSGKGVLVPTAGIGINADLSFSSLYATTNMHRVQFSAIAGAALTAGQRKSLFVSDGTGGLTANELYFLNSVGTAIKFTAGNSLNVAGFVGGIGGDYTSVSALLSYDDATKSYWHQQQGSPRPWATIRTGSVDIYEPLASIVARVRLASPAALAASYALTFPGALPAGNGPMVVDSTGAISYAETRMHSCAFAVPAAGVTQGANLQLLTTTANNFLPCLLFSGRTITGWTVWIQKTSAAGTITATMFALDLTANTTAAIGSAASNSANNPGFVTLSQSGLSTQVSSSKSYHIVLTGGGTTGDIVVGYAVTLA